MVFSELIYKPLLACSSTFSNILLNIRTMHLYGPFLNIVSSTFLCAYHNMYTECLHNIVGTRPDLACLILNLLRVGNVAFCYYHNIIVMPIALFISRCLVCLLHLLSLMLLELQTPLAALHTTTESCCSYVGREGELSLGISNTVEPHLSGINLQGYGQRSETHKSL